MESETIKGGGVTGPSASSSPSESSPPNSTSEFAEHPAWVRRLASWENYFLCVERDDPVPVAVQ